MNSSSSSSFCFYYTNVKCDEDDFCLSFVYYRKNTTMQPGGQSIVDRLLAAKNTIAGQTVAKVVCKATTEEIIGPKRKHIDCKIK
jgi:hypothetical protein